MYGKECVALSWCPEKTPIKFLKNLNHRTLSSWRKKERSKMPLLQIDKEAFGQNKACWDWSARKAVATQPTEKSRGRQCRETGKEKMLVVGMSGGH